MICNNNVSILRRFRDITLFAMHVTAVKLRSLRYGQFQLTKTFQMFS